MIAVPVNPTVEGSGAGIENEDVSRAAVAAPARESSPRSIAHNSDAFQPSASARTSAEPFTEDSHVPAPSQEAVYGLQDVFAASSRANISSLVLTSDLPQVWPIVAGSNAGSPSAGTPYTLHEAFAGARQDLGSAFRSDLPTDVAHVLSAT
ncbi:hypothetical protein EXIGLDRAFT_767978 [Exidia glandulosa HHB12029]|uniref:Uncharacterized protein n=1 Tax=Exidia glandulosa HHB12029 TaxID=1314781 RepID=A0A165ILL7_EXIGL|nr:hypothetical protein EXIGLDRAFT_767978 [Exidia glandulosa HHB12029]